MSKSIKLSPKYGVNPTFPVCFFCGEDKNEIALMGHIGDGRKHEDIEAPMRMVLDYNPCDCCREKFSQGVLVIEVTQRPLPDGRPPISQGAYPTGRHVVVRKGVLDFDGDKCLMLDTDFEQLFGGAMQ